MNLILFTIFLLAVGSAHAKDSRSVSAPIEKIRWVTPDDWPRYVDKNGQGLYVDIMEAVFKRNGILIDRERRPWKRALYEVKIGKADITGAQAFDKDFVMSREAVLDGCELLLFRSRNSAGPRRATLKSSHGVWVSGYTSAYSDERKNLLRGFQVKSRQAALQMLIKGRVDYYLDNEIQMAQTLESMKLNPNSFVREVFFCTPIYMVFSSNTLGRSIRDYYDKRFGELRRSSDLSAIYRTWGFTIPNQISFAHNNILKKSE